MQRGPLLSASRWLHADTVPYRIGGRIALLNSTTYVVLPKALRCVMRVWCKESGHSWSARTSARRATEPTPSLRSDSGPAVPHRLRHARDAVPDRETCPPGRQHRRHAAPCAAIGIRRGRPRCSTRHAASASQPVGHCRSAMCAGCLVRGPRLGARSAMTGQPNACGRVKQKGPGRWTRPFDAGPLARARQYLSRAWRASGAGRWHPGPRPSSGKRPAPAPGPPG